VPRVDEGSSVGTLYYGDSGTPIGIEDLMRSANSTGGIMLVEEHIDTEAPEPVIEPVFAA
jgi:hypothetical protein